MSAETIIVEAGGKGLKYLWNRVILSYINKKRDERKRVWKMIEDIHSELKFNGGGSVKDAIWDLKKGMANIDTRLHEIDIAQRVTLNLQGISFWLSDPEGECFYVSPNLCRIIGRSESDLLGNNWIAWVVPEDKDRIFESWCFSIDNKTPFDEQYTFRKSDGMYQKVWGLAFHKKVNDGFTGIMGKIEPIGEPFKK